jgi:PAS domain S-box-containing protein
MAEKLRVSEERHRTVIENLGEGIGHVNPNEEFTFANPAAEEIFGLPPGGLLGRSLRELTPADQFDRIREQTGKRRVGETSAYDVIIRRSDGEARHLLVTAVPQFDHEGKFTGTFGVFRDITERRRAQEALRHSESSLQAILRSTADGLLAVNTENQVMLANERFAEMWRIPAEMLTARDDAALLRHVLEQLVEPQSFLRKVQELYCSEEESFDTLHFKDGRVFERLSRPLLEGGKPCGRVWSFRDVTERKLAETERERLIGELRQTLAEVKTLGGLLPICAGCKKIRDDTGYWNQVEVYIQRHTDAKFSHGMCPECIKAYYPELGTS